ncbi:hypothetical protein GS458_1713 [Geobacillus stearothermophilus]|nr:hypothetical protein GS458_1713 [Geobacillus stearothermophilus]MED0661958.1 hypothetical protein [Geobacillus thermodenitrificans]
MPGIFSDDSSPYSRKELRLFGCQFNPLIQVAVFGRKMSMHKTPVFVSDIWPRFMSLDFRDPNQQESQPTK